MDLSNHVLDWGVHFGTTWRIQRMHMGEDAASGYHYCSNLLFTSLPPVVEAGNLKAISNPVKCFVVTVFARQEHISETAEHRTTASVWARTSGGASKCILGGLNPAIIYSKCGSDRASIVGGLEALLPSEFGGRAPGHGVTVKRSCHR